MDRSGAICIVSSTAQQPKCRLLALPREIRDQIYGYIFQHLELSSIDKLGGSKVVVSLINAPCVSVLLTHPRLHEEYSESHCFTDLSATIHHVDVLAKVWNWPADGDPGLQDEIALSYVKNVSLRYKYRQELPLDQLALFIEALSKRVDVHTLRITEDGYAPTLRFIGPHRTCYGNLIRANPPSERLGLPLVQHATGLRLEKKVLFTAEGAPILGTSGGALEHIYEPIRATVYSSRPTCEYSWTADEALVLRVTTKFAKEIRKRVLECVQNEKRRRSVEMLYWKEKDLQKD